MDKISGKVLTLGENIGASRILSPEFYGESADSIEPNLTFANDLDIDLSGDEEVVLIVGANFGYGSVNESVLIALQKAGVQAIIGTEFPNYVYRNGLNLGLPVFISESVSNGCSDGDMLSIDVEEGVVKNESTGEKFGTEARPDFIKRLMGMGGVTSFIQTLREQETEE